MKTVEILEKLVAFPSVVGRPNDQIVHFIVEYLRSHGVEAAVLPGPEGDRSNLFASIGPPNLPGYVLSGHLDVVPAADQPGWKGDPFVLRQDGDRLIGRGSVDMKGFVASVLGAVPDLVALDLKAPVHIALSYDEEEGCRGVPHLIAAMPDLCAPPHGCIIGEPTGMTPVLRHKGKATLRLNARGKSGHSSTPGKGINAIHMLLPALSSATELAAKLAEAAQHEAFDPPCSTAQIGTVNGGTAVNIIPDEAEALVELRAIPGVAPEALLAPVIEAARSRGVETEIVAQYPGLDLDPETPLAKLLADLTGNAAAAAVSFGTEAGVFQAAGYPAIVCGPGDIDRAHKPEEYITPAELESARRLILKLASQL